MSELVLRSIKPIDNVNKMIYCPYYTDDNGIITRIYCKRKTDSAIGYYDLKDQKFVELVMGF